MQVAKNYWKNKSKRNWIIFIATLVLIVLLSYFKGKEAYSIAKKYLNLVEQQELRKIESINDSLKVVVQSRDTIIDNLEKRETVIIKDYYNDFINEKKRADRLQLEKDNLIDILYSKQRLDSLADNARYPRQRP